jgi:hypothetical protein
MHPMRAAGALAIALSIGWTVTDASAQGRGGLSESQIRYYCSLGDQTPRSVRPYCGGGGDRGSRPEMRREYYGHDDRYYNDGYDQGRPLSRSELRYYCSLGDQTPVSARADCARYGFWR